MRKRAGRYLSSAYSLRLPTAASILSAPAKQSAHTQIQGHADLLFNCMLTKWQHLTVASSLSGPLGQSSA